jgi:uncharacterized membrane protein YdjX (TVP38/TMEM64 family)
MGNRHLKKILIAVVIILLIAVFELFHLDRFFTLSYVKASQEQFSGLYAAHRGVVIAAYMGTYIVMTSLSLPGATVMTLLGGAVFGLVVGGIAVSFASTIGATLACIVSRYVLRDWVQGRFGDKLRIVNEGIEREGAFYLLTLRLIPLFPFWLINLSLGLTKLPVRTYYWVSQVGMLPGTLVYVNAGRELAKVESISGILSPGLIFSFALLGVFPLVTKKAVALYKARQEKTH